MNDFLKIAVSFLLLSIKKIEWDDDSLILSGGEWSFVTCSAWRVSQDKNYCLHAGVIVRMYALMSWPFFQLSKLHGSSTISRQTLHLLFLMVEEWVYFVILRLSMGL